MDLLTVLRTLADRLLGWLLIAAGALALLLGYLGVKDTAYVVEQLPYVVSGGLFGLFLLGLGAVLLLSADLRDQWRVLLDIRDDLAATSVAEVQQGDVSTDELPARRPRAAATSAARTSAL